MGNPSIGNINKDYTTGALEQQENQTRRNSSSNDVRETKMNKNLKVATKSKDINVVIDNLRNSNSTKQNDLTKINEALNVVNDKVTITNNTRYRHEGDEEYTEVKERNSINEEEESKNISSNKLENDDLTRNISTNELKITDDNIHKHRSQNASSVNKQDELDKVNTPFKS